MTEVIAMSEAAAAPGRPEAGSQAGRAGSELYRAWSSKKVDGALRRAAEREYRVLSALAFIVLLPVVAVMRLLPPRVRGGASPHRSVFAEARAKADAVIPIVFMA
jgi:hypothetical protein